MSVETGTTCTLYYDCGDVAPEEGDFVRSSGGSCYRIDRVRRSPSRPERAYLKVTRLGKDVVQLGEPGVWPLYWYLR